MRHSRCATRRIGASSRRPHLLPAGPNGNELPHWVRNPRQGRDPHWFDRPGPPGIVWAVVALRYLPIFPALGLAQHQLPFRLTRFPAIGRPPVGSTSVVHIPPPTWFLHIRIFTHYVFVCNRSGHG